MILRLTRQTVRHTWPAYLGAFVALALGVTLLGITVGLIAAITVATDAPGVTRAERIQLGDLSSVFGVMSGISLFMALFVVGSTFGFVVATRRRELGLLRLIGATPRQVRMLVLLESAVVAVVATIVGCLLTSVLMPLALWSIRSYGLTDLHLQASAAWTSWAIAGPCGAAVALAGCWRSSKRASRVPPTAALLEAAADRRHPTVLGLTVSVACLGCVATIAALAGDLRPPFVITVAVFLPAVMVIGVMCVGTFIFPWLAGLIARPFVGLDVSARIGRDRIAVGARSTAALAAPVLAMSAIAGSLILISSFTVDWTTAQDRARLGAPLVIETGGHAAAVDAVAGHPLIGTVDARRSVSLHTPVGSIDVDVIDLESAAAARGLQAAQGDLNELHGQTLAVSESWTNDVDRGVGDAVPALIDGQRLDLRIVAVVPDAPGLYGELIASEDLVARQVADVVPDVMFVLPRTTTTSAAARSSLERALADSPGSKVLTSEAWLAQNEKLSRRASRVGLGVLLGPAGIYAAIAMVNATLIGASQRRRQDAVVRLLGATPHQVRRMATWEAVFISTAGLAVGGLITGFVACLLRLAIARDIAGAATTIPWHPLLGIATISILLAVAAAVAGAPCSYGRTRHAPGSDRT
jgi:putative ABC transport system permease protein